MRTYVPGFWSSSRDDLTSAKLKAAAQISSVDDIILKIFGECRPARLEELDFYQDHLTAGLLRLGYYLPSPLFVLRNDPPKASGLSEGPVRPGMESGPSRALPWVPIPRPRGRSFHFLTFLKEIPLAGGTTEPLGDACLEVSSEAGGGISARFGVPTGAARAEARSLSRRRSRAGRVGGIIGPDGVFPFRCTEGAGHHSTDHPGQLIETVQEPLPAFSYGFDPVGRDRHGRCPRNLLCQLPRDAVGVHDPG
jgi:hypothetical protein